MTGPTTPQWRKASDSAETNCVEMAELSDGRLGIRSDLDPERVLELTKAEVAAFFRGVKGGEFDDLAG